MKVLWAPWRMEYVGAPKTKGCILCHAYTAHTDRQGWIIHRLSQAFLILNTYPYNPGHMMVATSRHVARFDDLEAAERLDVMEGIALGTRTLEHSMRPDGFNIGANLGRVAGAGVEDHLHVHLIPRWTGDTNFMPVLADVKVIPEHLEATYEKLRTAVRDLVGGLPGHDEHGRPPGKQPGVSTGGPQEGSRR